MSAHYETNVRRLAAWMAERHAIYMRKTWLEDARDNPETHNPEMSYRMRAAWPGSRFEGRWTLDWLTDDPILREFRFCNVYRELDRVTRWINQNISEPFADHKHLWFMLAIARTINWPDTLEGMITSTRAVWPDKNGFCPENMTEHLDAWSAAGNKVYTGAYMIRAESDQRKPWYSWSKQRYVSEIVLGRLWRDQTLWRDTLDEGLRLEEAWRQFQEPHYVGWGPFMAYQVVVDWRWTRYLYRADDIQTWAALGPGSRRGLNRLHGRPVNTPLSQEQGCTEMVDLRHTLERPGLLAPWLDLPDLSDVQNCLCEYDKYERVRLGEGRPRARYVPGRGS